MCIDNGIFETQLNSPCVSYKPHLIPEIHFQKKKSVCVKKYTSGREKTVLFCRCVLPKFLGGVGKNCFFTRCVVPKFLGSGKRRAQNFHQQARGFKKRSRLHKGFHDFGQSRCRNIDCGSRGVN